MLAANLSCSTALHVRQCLQNYSSRVNDIWLKAVAWLIDELKAKVPIWKKEVFEGGEVWKENAESRLLAGQGTSGSN